MNNYTEGGALLALPVKTGDVHDDTFGITIIPVNCATGGIQPASESNIMSMAKSTEYAFPKDKRSTFSSQEWEDLRSDSDGQPGRRLCIGLTTSMMTGRKAVSINVMIYPEGPIKNI